MVSLIQKAQLYVKNERQRLESVMVETNCKPQKQFKLANMTTPALYKKTSK